MPRHLRPRLASGDLESSLADLLAHVKVRRRTTNGSQLVAETAVDGFKPGWQLDCGCSLRIQFDYAVVDILSLRRFDKGMIENLGVGTKRVVNLKTAAEFMLSIWSPSVVCHEVPGLIWSTSSQGLMPSFDSSSAISRTAGLSALLCTRIHQRFPL